MTETKTAELVDLVELREDVETSGNKWSSEARDMLAEIQSYPVTTGEDFEMMSKLHAAAKKKEKDATAELKNILSPLKETEKRLRAFFAPALDFYKSAIEISKQSLLGYNRAVEAERRAEALRISKELEAEKEKREADAAKAAAEARESGNEAVASAIEEAARFAPTPVLPASAPSVPKIKGQSIGENWKARPAGARKTYDESAVPLDWRYVSVDQKKLDALAKSSHGEATIPGVELFDAGVIRNRS